jgi:hypothetical protein
VLSNQISEKSIPQLARRRFQTDASLPRMSRHIIAVAIKLQIMLASQTRDESLIRIRLRPPHFVIEMNDRENNPQLTPQLEQQPKKRNRIAPPGNGHACAVPSR